MPGANPFDGGISASQPHKNEINPAKELAFNSFRFSSTRAH